MALTKAQLIDLNANELIIDLDADTSIHADTDDQIDIKIAGADDFRFTANTFTALSGSTIAAQALTATTLTTTGAIAIANDGNIGSAGDADAIAISSSGVVTFSQTPVLSGASLTAGTTPLTTLDIDGGTDIGGALDDADLFVVDDGAGGTNRKITASRVKTYMGAEGGAFSLTNLDIDGATDIGAAIVDADLFIVDDGAGGTNRKATAARVLTYIESSITTTGALDSGSITSGFGAIDNGTSNIRSATITAETAFVPDAANGATLGTASLEFADIFLHDGAQILFGADQDVLLSHVADAGLTLKTATTSDDTKATLTLQTGDTDIAANDVLGQLHFQAPDEGAGTDAILVAAGIAAISEGDFSASNNATKLSFQTGASEAASEKMSLSSGGNLTVSGDVDIKGGAIFNEDSADKDFRVESNGETHMLFVDGGNDHVNIAGGGTDGGGVLNVFSADNTTTLSLVGTDSDANSGPILSMERSANSAADADFIGSIVYKAQNDANETLTYGQIDVQIDDASDGTEDGQLFLRSMSAGTLRNRLAVYGSSVVINDDSIDSDFRVETNSNANMFIVNGADDKIYINATSTISGASGYLQIQHAYTRTAIDLQSNSTSAHHAMTFHNPNGQVGSINTSGSAVQFNTSSDYRLKENVDYNFDATTRLKQLKPARFNFKSDTDKTVDGFLAHEVSSIIPEAIFGEKDAVNDDGNPVYQGIDQSKLVPLLVKTIQELEARIKTLEDA